MSERQLRDFLKGRFRGYHDTLAVDDDLTMFVDSLGLFDLVAFVEETFGVSVPTQEFTPARFSSLRRILTLVEELRAD